VCYSEHKKLEYYLLTSYLLTGFVSLLFLATFSIGFNIGYLPIGFLNLWLSINILQVYKEHKTMKQVGVIEQKG
jgi:hypothetical protein